MAPVGGSDRPGQVVFGRGGLVSVILNIHGVGQIRIVSGIDVRTHQRNHNLVTRRNRHIIEPYHRRSRVLIEGIRAHIGGGTVRVQRTGGITRVDSGGIPQQFIRIVTRPRKHWIEEDIKEFIRRIAVGIDGGDCP